jgi:hypothetical protein
MAKQNTTLAARIEDILTTEIPGTPKINLRKTARHLARMLTTEIPGTPKTMDVARQIADLLTREIPGTEHIGVRAVARSDAAKAFSAAGRVEYTRLKGSVKNLSARAQQVIETLDRHKGHGTSADLQKWMKVNRNVIAGALHELRQHRLIRSNRIGA